MPRGAENVNQLIIILPLPPRVLSPNASRHWRASLSSKKKARADAGFATIAAIREQHVDATWKRARLQATFAFRVRRHHDEDNLTAWLKAYADGIADALKMNDRNFRWLPPLQRVDPLKQSVTIVVTEDVPEKPAEEPF
jgi:crossover junction endodeoxyribonuclease RusA